MKISEIKELLKEYNEKEKDRIIIELYNKIPKGMRRDKDIDYYLQNAHLTDKKREIVVCDKDLIAEIDYFLECAEGGLYASPNRIISKSERSSWNTKAKKYYKALVNTDPSTYEGQSATKYLIRLFKLLSYGTHTLVFSGWKTFSRIYVDELEYLSILYKRILINGYTDENLETCANLSLIYPDEYVLASAGITMLNDMIQDIETKIRLIEILKKDILNYKNKNLTHFNYTSYYQFALLYVYFSIQYFSEGIIYYLKNCNSKLDKKINAILKVLDELGYHDEWLELYEKYEKKVEMPDDLKKQYKELKKNMVY